MEQLEGQLSIFDIGREKFKITKPIRLIELFAGVGSQAMALKNIGADFERWKVVEFDKYAIASYNAIHGTNFSVMDITKTHAEDLDIVNKEKYCYIMFYSFPCTDLSVSGKMLGMEEGIFPHQRSFESASELEEERRLCYVGIIFCKGHLPSFSGSGLRRNRRTMW